MLGLPHSTEVNIEIPTKKLFRGTRNTRYLREVFAEQVENVIWANKVSYDTIGIAPGKQFAEIEVLQISLSKDALDKRALRYIDIFIPYYVLYVLCHKENKQIWLGDKVYGKKDKIQVLNYCRTQWISEDDFLFPVGEQNIDDTYSRCKDNIENLRFGRSSVPLEITADTFVQYCQNMRMTYSYKPLLILALIQNGGCVSAENMARYFQKYYTQRKHNGLKVEKKGCIFADENATLATMMRNVVANPFKALMNSGLFNYDSEIRLLFIKPAIYDELTLEHIERIEAICQNRLIEYFSIL